jgi:GntR family phosphonate transport system transcriptional regulator
MTSERTGLDDASAVRRARQRQPRWREIQHEIEQRIGTGAYQPAEQLPTEEELARQFQVHRHTIRRAINRLQEKQLLRVERGRGVFVREPAVNYRLGRNTRLTVAAVHSDRKHRREVLSATRIAANSTLASALSLPLDHPLLRVNMVRVIDDRRISVASCYYPLPRFQGIDKLIRQRGTITDAMRHFGVSELARKSLRISATMPTAKDAELLKISRSKPLLELFHIVLDQNGIPVQVGHSRFVPAWLNLVIDF